MPLPDSVKDVIDQAWVDGYPCLLGTIGKTGPNISPKGSLFVYDDTHFAYWERAKMKALENLGRDNRVVVCYPRKGFTLGKLNGYWRFYGTAEVHESGPLRDEVYARLVKREQDRAEKDGAGIDTGGVAVLITIESSADSRGVPIM